jgi:hypothetical protein
LPNVTPGSAGVPDTAFAAADSDRAFLRKLVDIFSAQCPRVLGEIRDSILRGEGATLELKHHRGGSCTKRLSCRGGHMPAACDECGFRPRHKWNERSTIPGSVCLSPSWPYFRGYYNGFLVRGLTPLAIFGLAD